MVADLTAPLNDDQIKLLKVVMRPHLVEWRWPNLAYVKRELRASGLDAVELLRSLPRHRQAGSVTGYGAAIFDNQGLAPGSEVKLTMVAALHAEDLVPRAQSFLMLLKALRRHLQTRQQSPFKLETVRVRSNELSDGPVGGFSPPFAKGAAGLLLIEPINFLNSVREAPEGNGVYEMTLGESLLEFEDVNTIARYVDRVVELLGGDESPEAAWPATTDPGRYIAPSIIDRLQAAQPTAEYNLKKLISLLQELDDCYHLGHVYASHALLRAVLDHIPPVFEQKNYGAVVNNVPWSRTDRSYIKQLDLFRVQADDVLHRQMRKTPEVLDIDDLPRGAAVNALLNAVLDEL